MPRPSVLVHAFQLRAAELEKCRKRGEGAVAMDGN